LVPDRDQALLILRPDVKLLDCLFDGGCLIRRVDEADKCGRRRFQAPDFQQ
jgi:hypothetical protein